MCTFLFSGMTISLIICTFFENGTNLRPILDPDKIFLLLPWLLCTVPIPVQTYFRASMYTIPSVPILPSIKASVSGKNCLKGRRSHFNRSDLSFYCIFKAALHY